MRKFFTLFLSVTFASFAFAQRPTDVIKKTDTKPVIDGVLDDGIWDAATVNAIDKPFTGETPTLGDPGQTNWRALWDDDGIYVFVTVTDDVYMPVYDHTGNSYEYDHVEIYFDTNFLLEDGLGPQTDGNGNGNGHYQFADDIKTGIDDGTMQTRDDGAQYAMLADGTNYNEEYFIPFSKLITGDGAPMDKTQEIGFDVVVIDDDVTDTPDTPVRNRAVWSNDGSITSENWVNMDEAGKITLEGAEAGIPIDGITIASGGDITADNQTVQMVITELVPDNVTDSTVTWYVITPDGSNGRATISKTGLLTPILDGDVEVWATSPDKFAESNHVTVHISGQVVTLQEVNIIKNGYFDQFDETTLAPTSWGNWVDGAVPTTGDSYGTVPVVNDGVAVLNVTGSNDTEQYHYQFSQSNLTGLPDIPYTLSFVSWSDVDRDATVDFEDSPDNNYNRYGATTDAESGDGRSEWHYALTTEKTRYTFHVTFDQMVETTVQKLQWLLTQSIGTVYIDSVTLVSDADMALVSTAVTPERAMQEFSVYPNPATSTLNIDLPTTNTKVTIYNSVGITMEETIVEGTHHVFDVSNYNKGLYFIKANDTVMKFIR